MLCKHSEQKEGCIVSCMQPYTTGVLCFHAVHEGHLLSCPPLQAEVQSPCLQDIALWGKSVPCSTAHKESAAATVLMFYNIGSSTMHHDTDSVLIPSCRPNAADYMWQGVGALTLAVVAIV